MSDSAKPVAVVTGANRGLGLETARQLAKRDIRVIITSRNAGKGEMALEKLQAEGLDVLLHPLDVASENSVGLGRSFTAAVDGWIFWSTTLEFFSTATVQRKLAVPAFSLPVWKP